MYWKIINIQQHLLFHSRLLKSLTLAIETEEKTKKKRKKKAHYHLINNLKDHCQLQVISQFKMQKDKFLKLQLMLKIQM